MIKTESSFILIFKYYKIDRASISFSNNRLDRKCVTNKKFKKTII